VVVGSVVQAFSLLRTEAVISGPSCEEGPAWDHPAIVRLRIYQVIKGPAALENTTQNVGLVCGIGICTHQAGPWSFTVIVDAFMGATFPYPVIAHHAERPHLWCMMSKSQLLRDPSMQVLFAEALSELPQFIIDDRARVRSLREFKKQVNGGILWTLWMRAYLRDVFTLIAIALLLMLCWKMLRRGHQVRALIPSCLSTLTLFLWFNSYCIPDSILTFWYGSFEDQIIRSCYHLWLFFLFCFLIERAWFIMGIAVRRGVVSRGVNA